MKKTLLLVLVLTTFSIHAQTASDVLRNGIRIGEEQKIFIKFQNKGLRFAFAKSLQDPSNPPYFTTLKDSAIILAPSNSTTVYLLPLNPLNYSFTSKNTVIIDPINQEVSKAITDFSTIFSTIKKTMILPGKPAAGKIKQTKAARVSCPSYNSMQQHFDIINKQLLNDQKPLLVEQFGKLKELDFADKEQTWEKIELVRTKLEDVEDHYAFIERSIKETYDDLPNYDCEDAALAKQLFIMNLESMKAKVIEQRKYLKNIKKMYDLVHEEWIKAAKGGGSDGLRWCIELEEVPSERGKISVYTLAIKKAGYKLSSENEIIAEDESSVTKSTIKIRRFQRFVPEVSVGIAYTAIDYYTYGTTSDETGQSYIAAPSEDQVKKINLSTMINFVYFVPNTDILPFYQLGVGINTGIPSILSGFGLRTNFDDVKRLSISAGAAMSWIKDLNELEVGDPVSGTDQIEKDLHYVFSPVKLYVSLQFNF